MVADFAYTSFGSLKTNAKGWAYDYLPASPDSVHTVSDGSQTTSAFDYNTTGTLKHRSAGVLPVRIPTNLNARSAWT